MLHKRDSRSLRGPLRHLVVGQSIQGLPGLYGEIG
jgi:hypothetical protein